MTTPRTGPHPRPHAGRGPIPAAPPEPPTSTTPGNLTALWASARVTELLDGQPAETELPVYGSRAWHQLPQDDPRRAAAIFTAAEVWRREEAERERLDQLAEADPDGWFTEIVEPANEAARRFLQREKAAGRAVSSRPTFAELEQRRRQHPPAHVVQAAPGWTPIAIPGRPGWWRHLINGEQVDLPSRSLPASETAA